MTLVRVRGYVGLHELVKVLAGGKNSRREAVVRLRRGRRHGQIIVVPWRSRLHRSRVRVVGGKKRRRR